VGITPHLPRSVDIPPTEFASITLASGARVSSIRSRGVRESLPAVPGGLRRRHRNHRGTRRWRRSGQGVVMSRMTWMWGALWQSWSAGGKRWVR